MIKEMAHTIPADDILSSSLSVTDLFSRPLEKIKLQHRAEKYLFKEDRGGIAYIRKTVQKGDIVFDIGAHKAGYLYFFLEQLGESGSIFAFEPQALLYKYLQKLKHLFTWQNVHIEPAAVSDRSGTALLCIPHNSGRLSSPCATIIESHMSFTYQAKEQVNTVSIDEYCRRYSLFPDFLKIDVEGNELLVFKGAREILQICKPRILFECEARFVGEETLFETFRFLENIGYTGYFIMGDAICPIAEFDISQHQHPDAGTYCNNFIFE